MSALVVQKKWVVWVTVALTEVYNTFIVTDAMQIVKNFTTVTVKNFVKNVF